jgi:diacylglycerol kinase (ATP)
LFIVSALNGETTMDAPKKARIIINPHSGTEDKSGLEAQLKKALDEKLFSYEIFFTKGPKEATALSREAASLGYDLVIAVGGDGTVNEVGKGLIGTETVLGIIPVGSGNGFAKHLHIPAQVEEAIRTIQEFQVQRIDTIQANGEYILGVGGIGFDAHISLKFAESKRRGLASYAILVFKEYPSYNSKTYQLTVDGKLIQRTALIVSFAKSTQYGNNYYIAPQAKMNDGLMHLIFLKEPPFYAIPGLILQVKNGTIEQSRYYESIPCKEIDAGDQPIQAHIDGEPIYFPNGLKLKVLPKSLKVITGK